MELDYEKNAKLLKVLADANRLKIIDILSCGERCACDILENFDITQPTLSHHMKILTEAGLVKVRKDGIWNNYSLDLDNCNDLVKMLSDAVNNTKDCICDLIEGSCGTEQDTAIPVLIKNA